MKLVPVTSADEAAALVDTRYQTMCRAIAECAAVDEVKDIRDKAVALEVYARQANNFEAERTAQEIRVRAEKRVGELLKEHPAAPRGGDHKSVEYQRSCESTIDFSPHPESLKALGISKDHSSQWQQLAAVPDETFEAVMADKSEPITAQRVLNVHRLSTEAQQQIPTAKPESVKPVDRLSIHLWGELRDVVRNLKEINIAHAIREMPDYLREGMVESMNELDALLHLIGDEYERTQRNR